MAEWGPEECMGSNPTGGGGNSPIYAVHGVAGVTQHQLALGNGLVQNQLHAGDELLQPVLHLGVKCCAIPSVFPLPRFRALLLLSPPPSLSNTYHGPAALAHHCLHLLKMFQCLSMVTVGPFEIAVLNVAEDGEHEGQSKGKQERSKKVEEQKMRE